MPGTDGHRHGDGFCVQCGQVCLSLPSSARMRCSASPPCVAPSRHQWSATACHPVVMPASARPATTSGRQAGCDGPHECFRGPAGIEFVAGPVRARADHGGLMVVARNGQHRTGQPRHPGVITDPSEGGARRDQRRHQRLACPRPRQRVLPPRALRQTQPSGPRGERLLGGLFAAESAHDPLRDVEAAHRAAAPRGCCRSTTGAWSATTADASAGRSSPRTSVHQRRRAGFPTRRGRGCHARR